MIIAVAIVLAFLAPYLMHGAFRFLAASAIILLLAGWRWPETWPKHLGFLISPLQLRMILGLGVTVFLGSRFFIHHIANLFALSFVGTPSLWGHVAPFFQSVNEEVVLRALFLNWVGIKIKNKVVLSASVATIFSALHWIFYHFNDAHPVNLHAVTLMNLWLFGFICNELYLLTGHIGWGLAIHAGWNLTRFSGDLVLNGKPVPEGMTFNLIEGSDAMTLALVLAFLVMVIVIIPRNKRSTNEVH